MQFRIADTFTDSLARLTNDEQKAVKTTAFDLQMNPANPGMQFHRIDRAKDKNFWSVRVNRDVRIIVHRNAGSLTLCYVDHHDDAYAWAERRKMEVHPRTGAAQLVEIRERVEEIVVPSYVVAEKPAPSPLLFEHVSDEDLLRYGVPVEWLKDVRQATEDSLLDLADHLPAEAAEALLEVATGNVPEVAAAVPEDGDPFHHPDARRRFRTVENVEELERALEFPWEKWAVFLHPAQRDSVERDYSGPARISGSAGTGKTIVALHRAVHLARTHPDARILLTTFSDVLAASLRRKLRGLISNEPQIAERLEVHSLDAVGRRLYERNFGRVEIASPRLIETLLQEIAEKDAQGFSLRFLMSEWEHVVDAWQLDTWEAYRDVARLGRKTRLPEKRRSELWRIFEAVRRKLKERGLVSTHEVFTRLAEHFSSITHPPFDFIVVDEAQDISVAQLRFLAALGGDRPNGLFFTGDLGQRIFQQPFSWTALGVDIRGRSAILRVNYRTSHQIRAQADRLLGLEISDVDGITVDRRGTVSVFNGPDPVIELADSPENEIGIVADWLSARISDGVPAEEIGVFVRSGAELHLAQRAAEEADLSYRVLDERFETTSGRISISTMHLAKGLEYRAVVVMACDDDVIPLQERIEAVADEADLEEVYNTERHLLYVACTRARDHLLVTGVEPGSEFLEDMGH